MPHDGREGLQDLHHDGVFRDRVGFLEAAAGDGVHGRIDGILSALSLLVEYSQAEDLEDGLEGGRGGRSGDVVALDHVQERGHVHGWVDGSPFLLRLEEHGSEGFQGLRYGSVAALVGLVVVRVGRPADHCEDSSDLGVQHAGEAKVFPF